MRRVLGLILTGLFFCASAIAWGQQVSRVPPVTDSDHPSGQNISPENLPPDRANCGPLVDAARAASEAVERDRRELSVAADPGGASGVASTTGSAGPFPSDLRQDLIVLRQREEALNRCNNGVHSAGSALIPGPGCSSEQILNFQMSHYGESEQEIPIRRLPGTLAFFYEAGMSIDADGAPNAYHPENTGLDDIANAGGPGNWEGLAKNRYGDPFVQGPDDPFPGFFISATALVDHTRPVNDPLRYVDASRIPYVVLPGGTARQLGARPGDFSLVLNQRNGRSSYAIFGDVGPPDRIGEGSVALAENLGIRSDARTGGARDGILYLVFPGSGDGRPRATEEINAESEKLFQAWGGSNQLAACKGELPARPYERNRNAN